MSVNVINAFCLGTTIEYHIDDSIKDYTRKHQCVPSVLLISLEYYRAYYNYLDTFVSREAMSVLSKPHPRLIGICGKRRGMDIIISKATDSFIVG